MLVGGIVVEDDVDRLASRDLALDSIEEADEFEMAVALHAAADHGAVEHAERARAPLLRGGAPVTRSRRRGRFSGCGSMSRRREPRRACTGRPDADR
jgi:hypothetical protein